MPGQWEHGNKVALLFMFMKTEASSSQKYLGKDNLCGA